MKSGTPFRYNGGFLPSLVVIVLFSVLIIRLFGLQVVRSETYRRLSEENSIRKVPVDAPRGYILDRHGKILVCNRPSYVISIIPFELTKMDTTIQLLGEILDMDPQEIAEKVNQNKFRRFEPVKIKRDIDFKTLAVIQANTLELPGVIYQVEPRREYLQGELASHLLGAVREISSGELESPQYRSKYRYGSLIGKWGVEKEYEDALRGRDGCEHKVVSARGRVIGPFCPPESAAAGSDIVLTIDLALQRVAEEALSDTVSGAVVALDPRSGEVLAMVSRPTYDPNLFSTVVSESTWRSLNENPGHPLLNRAIQSSYPPGSAMKAITAGYGLKHGVIDERRRFVPCAGAYKFGARWFRCWQPEGHGSLALVGAMAQSCDVYFYQLGREMELDRWSRFATECGLGKALGLDLPDETGGLIPHSSFYNKRYGKGKWTKGVLLNLSIGQGEILATPLQMASLMAAVANGGTRYRPHILKEFRRGKRVDFGDYPKDVGQLPLSAKHLDVLKRSLRAVVDDPDGTGRLAAVEGVEVAGKTGTAQNPHGEDHAWFVAFAPLDNPKIVVAVLVEHGGHGGVTAAPIARRIIEAYLRRGGA